MHVRIALDVMGGDRAPASCLTGAALAVAQDEALTVLLVGPKTVLAEAPEHPRLLAIPSGPGVPEGGQPAAYLRAHPDASMAVAVGLVADKEAEAAVSVGHTGALMIAARWRLGTVPGVSRPAPAAVFPLGSQPVVLDIGANVDVAKRDYLAFAALGRAFAKAVKGVAAPRVALLANGAERGKGTKVLREAYTLLETRVPDFVGYLEPVEMFTGAADVLVADGFLGNIVLKTMEGVAQTLLPLAPPGDHLADLLARASDITGSGSPLLLLGTEGVVVPGHGRAHAADIARLIALAARAVRGGLLPTVHEAAAEIGLAEV
jgi:glycerol-3-phosphate acyltransferase PlsX